MARILSGEKRGIEMNGEEILGLRKALGCTQEEFSKILGVTAVALSRWETGKAVPQGRNVAQLDYLQAMLEKGDMEPETLKRILLVGGAVCRAGTSPLAMMASGLLTEESLVGALRNLFGGDSAKKPEKGDDADV